MGSVSEPPGNQRRKDQERDDFIPSWQHLSDDQLRDMFRQISVSDLNPEAPLTASKDAIPKPTPPRELLGQDELLEEFSKIAKNISEEPENPHTWRALEELLLEKTNWQKV